MPKTAHEQKRQLTTQKEKDQKLIDLINQQAGVGDMKLSMEDFYRSIFPWQHMKVKFGCVFYC